MRKKMLLIAGLFWVIIMSGCTTQSVKPHLLNVSDALSETAFKYWDDYAKNSNRQLVTEMMGGGESIREFDLCPLNVYEKDPKFYVYYLDECDFSKINELKNHDNYTDKTSYVGFSMGKAVSIVARKINSSFFDLYKREEITKDDSVDAIIKSITDKVTDTGVMVFVIGSFGSAYQYYLVPKIIECNESASCVDSFFEKMEIANPKIIQEIKFDNDFVDSCKEYLQSTDKNNTIAQLKDSLGKIFRKAGYTGNPDDYVSYTSICERAKTLYSSIYNGILDGVSEPTQRFYIATAFYILSNLGETQESFTDSLNELIS